jgi:hypothetical protein
VEKLFFFGGVASVMGGFAIIFYQGILFLQHDVWNSYPLFIIIDRGPGSLGETVAAYPALMNALQQCPSSAMLIALGLILLWVAGRLRNRYA